MEKFKRALMKLARSDRWTIENRELPSDQFEAFCKWDDDKVGHPLEIVTDTSQLSSVLAVVHEMTHYVLRNEMDEHFSPDLEEAIVIGICHWLRKKWLVKKRGPGRKPDTRMFDWWRKRINERLAANAEA